MASATLGNRPRSSGRLCLRRDTRIRIKCSSLVPATRRARAPLTPIRAARTQPWCPFARVFPASLLHGPRFRSAGRCIHAVGHNAVVRLREQGAGRQCVAGRPSTPVSPTFPPNYLQLHSIAPAADLSIRSSLRSGGAHFESPAGTSDFPVYRRGVSSPQRPLEPTVAALNAAALGAAPSPSILVATWLRDLAYAKASAPCPRPAPG